MTKTKRELADDTFALLFVRVIDPDFSRRVNRDAWLDRAHSRRYAPVAGHTAEAQTG